MNFIERLLGNDQEGPFTKEQSKYFQPRSVGSARVREILSFGHNPQFVVVYLDIKKMDPGDRSQEINRVPAEWFGVGDSAEVIVSEYKGSPVDPRSWPIVLNGGFCAVAIRPFNPSTYGKGLDLTDPIFQAMLDVNVKGPKFAPSLYQKFRL